MRFKEIISTQKIVDTKTGKEYYGMIDDELLELINELSEQAELYNQSLADKGDFYRFLEE